MLPRAIESFRSQSYPNRRMLILSDGEDVRDIVPNDPRISVVDLASQPRTIGEKRNIGCSLIESDLIAHFDDDDWAGPDRLADQVATLVKSDLSVTGYRTMLLTNGAQWWRYAGSPEGWTIYGASLMYWRDWWEVHPFQACHIGEDFLFANMADMASKMAVSNGDGMMVCSIHPGNTSTKATSSSRYERVTSAVAPKWFPERVF